MYGNTYKWMYGRDESGNISKNTSLCGVDKCNDNGSINANYWKCKPTSTTCIYKDNFDQRSVYFKDYDNDTKNIIELADKGGGRFEWGDDKAFLWDKETPHATITKVINGEIYGRADFYDCTNESILQRINNQYV